MALKLNERYPGRFNSPTSQYPQGSFKNRTAPGAKDGSYLEQDWANDALAFLSSLLSGAGITPNGNVDTVGASQYYTALQGLIGSDKFLKIANNLYEIKDAGPAAVAQTLANLGLGDAAKKNVGTTSGTVAAGDDSRIVNAVQSTNTAITLPGSLTTTGALKGSTVAAGAAVMGANGNITGGSIWSEGNLYTHIANVSNGYGVVAMARGASVVQSYTVEAPAGTYATNSGASTMRYRALFFKRPTGAWVQMGGDIN